MQFQFITYPALIFHHSQWNRSYQPVIVHKWALRHVRTSVLNREKRKELSWIDLHVNVCVLCICLQWLFHTYAFTSKILFNFGIFEIWSEIHTHCCIFINWNGWIVGTTVNIFEWYPLRFTIFKVNYFTTGHGFKAFQCFGYFILIFIVQMAFEFHQRLKYFHRINGYSICGQLANW